MSDDRNGDIKKPKKDTLAMSEFKNKKSKTNGLKDPVEKQILENRRGELSIRKLTRASKMEKDALMPGFHDPVEEINAKILEHEGMALLEIGDVQRLAGNEAVKWIDKMSHCSGRY